MNYFVVERNGQYWDNVAIKHDGEVVFKNYFNMTYDEMKSSEDLGEFVTAVMEAVNNEINGEDDQTAVTLVGEDGVFIWGIIMGKGDVDGDINYVLIDWQKDGKLYRYENENAS